MNTLIRTATVAALTLFAGATFAQAPDYIEPLQSSKTREQVRAEAIATKDQVARATAPAFIETSQRHVDRDAVRSATAEQLRRGVIARVNAAVPTQAMGE